MTDRSKLEYIIKPPSGVSFNFKELWSYRELFLFFAWRDIKVKYNQTLLGVTWVILQPLLLMAIFIFFFANKMELSTEKISPTIFYFSGLILWNLFNKGIASAGNSIILHSNLIKKIYFPRLVIPLSGILSALFDYLVCLVVFIILIALNFNTLSNFSIPIFIACLILASLIALLGSVGIGCFLASINVKYRDASYALPFFLQLLFFISPIIYSFSTITDPWIKHILALNPLTSAIMIMRYPFQSEVFDPTVCTIGGIATLIILIIGLYNFKRMEMQFADLA